MSGLPPAGVGALRKHRLIHGAPLERVALVWAAPGTAEYHGLPRSIPRVKVDRAGWKPGSTDWRDLSGMAVHVLDDGMGLQATLCRMAAEAARYAAPVFVHMEIGVFDIDDLAGGDMRAVKDYWPHSLQADYHLRWYAWIACHLQA